ncbi:MULTISPECIES: class I SAM-dependent methyltransferase [Methylomicrobium]|uniref:Tellurite resistance protein TehB n=1 Tax=Methylomicrobium album BG8 TaxID=686340 RepID=H8GP91_METAL|nr:MULTISPECIES: class I SAM-dependent methyltransferase [Methylomicrobium]EIC29677.1 Tellurite resistance protein TehB [Methylomicrobium album BG8]
MNELQEKWDRLYSLDEPGNQAPVPLLAENAFLLPSEGHALDLACGLGANAIFLAEHGLKVVALDISAVAIEKLQTYAGRRRLAIEAHRTAISSASLPSSAFDVIAVGRFLDRGLKDAIMNALKPGGLLFYQTFTRLKIGDEGPKNPAYLLDRSELLTLFLPLRPVFYRENAAIGDLGQGLRNEAQFIGQKPEQEIKS